METIELARALAAHGETEDAQNAFLLTLQQADGSDPAVELEAALYVFENGGDYRVPYTTFLSLYNRGHFQDELFDLMVSAFYAPNLTPQRRLYERNCKLLGKYKYCFRKDFLDFEELPIKFFPYDDVGYLPFSTRANQFGSYINFNHPVVSRNFFAKLDDPIFAENVYSQYELEYLNDNVRSSEWAARENHIYLHYTDCVEFCSYLQCLDLRDILKSEKIVILIEEEKSLYPIDFKQRYGIDYSLNAVKPFSVKEVKRLIWHTQLSSHNGGDFFNEVFYGHPNLLADESLMFHDLEEKAKEVKELATHNNPNSVQFDMGGDYDQRVMDQLFRLKNVTEKDALVAIFLARVKSNRALDKNARIAPAVFFQPHFSNLYYKLNVDGNGRTVLYSDQYRAIQKSPIFQGFQYIKTFTPIRRPTTSYAAGIRFMYNGLRDNDLPGEVVDNALTARLLNRSFMIDWQDRLFKDSVLVRFEDGKLNHKATFTALAAFLDVPYTASLTYCSGPEGLNPESFPGNALGFDSSTVYKTYDEYANETERYYLEYFLRDVYEFYGYDLLYYDGKPMNKERAEEMINGFTTLHQYVYQSHIDALNRRTAEHGGCDPAEIEQVVQERIKMFDAASLYTAQLLMEDLHFINKNGQPLHMMPLLKLDPALLEQPLYH